MATLAEGEKKVERIDISDLKLYVEDLPHVETVSVAFLVRIGSAHEGDSQAGISHFLEHVSFRGTRNFAMKELKYTVESVGGVLNAFTTPVSTVYYARVPSFQLKKTMKVLNEIVFYPLVREEDVEIERRIILEEIKMTYENPEERLYKMAILSVWGEPYGRDTLGYENTVLKFTSKEIRKYHGEKYLPSRVKVALAGNLEGLKEVLKELGDMEDKGKVTDPKEPDFKHNDAVKIENMRDINHVHVLILKNGLGKLDGDYEKMMVLDTILGSGMSSYLFEEIREKLGTVYDIYSLSYSLKKSGIYGIYFSTSPEYVERTLNEVKAALSRFRAKEYHEYGIKRRLGKFKMSMESPGGVVNYMVDKLLYSEAVEDPKEHERSILSITPQELEKFSEKFLEGNWSVFAVAPGGFSWEICRITI